MRNPKKVPILEPWMVRNRWEPLGFGLENRRVLGYLMPYNKQVKNENNGIPKKVPIMEDRFFGTVENP